MESQVSQAENMLVTCECEITVHTLQCIEVAHHDFHEKLEIQEKRGQEWLHRTEEAKDYRIQELEKSLTTSKQLRKDLSKRAEQLQKEVEHLSHGAEAVEEHFREVLGERSAHVNLLHRIFWHVRRSVEEYVLGDIGIGGLVMQSMGNLALRFDELTNKLEGLRAKLKAS